MNNMRKRIMSLALTGVLLMGSMPVQAWAEETQESVDPALTQQGGIDPVMPVNETVSVLVNGVAVSAGDEKISYADGKLTLNNADNINTIEVKGVALTIELSGKNVINAGDDVAITTDRDLTITGDGSLKITTSNAIAVEIEGAAEGAEDKNILTIDGAQVWVEVVPEEENAVTASATGEESDTEEELPVGISCADGVVIQGAAHFRTSYNAPGTVYTLAEGYVKNDEGAFEKAQQTWTVEEESTGAFEFVAAKHLGNWQESVGETTEHYKSCADSECVLISGVKVVHTASEKFKYKRIDNTQHQRVYECCEMKANGAEPEDHKLEYTANGASITATCASCKATETFTLTAENIEYGSNKKPVTFVAPTGVLAGKITESMVKYADAEGNTLDAAPTEFGNYTAFITIGDKRAEDSFSVTKIDFSKAVVTLELAEGGYTFNGEAHEPAVLSVKLNGEEINFANATIEYLDNTAAGEAKVMVTMSADTDYTNAAVATFTIAPKDITEVGLQLEETELEYNGTKQVPALKESALKLGDDYTVTEPEQAIAVGQYKLSVEGKGNYKGSVELPYSIAKTEYYTDATKTVQISGKNVGDLEQTKFTGVKIGDSVETVEGTCKYTFTYKDSTTEAVWSAIQNRVNDEMKAGDKAVIQYTFTPAGDGNYTGTKSGEIEVTKVDLTFEFDDGTKANADNVKKTGTITYGDTDAIKTAELTAKVNGSGEKGKGFTVKYAKVVDGTPEETKTDAFSAGSNRFWITYSGTIGGYSFTDVPVCEGWLSNVAPKTLAEGNLVPPRAVYISEKADGSPVELLTPAKKGYINDGKDGESLEYGLMTKDGRVDWSWKTKVPTATEEGCYDVYYRPSDNYASDIEGYVRVLVVPYLTATYGDKFNEITLPDGFTFNKTEHPDLTKTVGDAGERNVYLDYTHPNDDPDVQNDYPTLTGYKVKMKVDPKEVTAIYSVLNADVYDKNGDDWVAFASTTKDDLFIVKADGQKLVPGTDYTVEKTASTDGLEVQHNFKCKDGGNYKFEPFSSERVYVYRAKHAKLESDNFPEEILKGTEYDTLDKAKKALKEEVKGEDTKCPDEYMKFFKIYLMKQSGARLADNQWVEHMEEGMFPPAGLTYEIPNADLDNATEKDAFRVAVLYLAGENEGKIIQLYKENGEFELTDTGLQINDLDREALVCVAREVDLTKEYTITKSITLDSKNSTQGTLTIKVDDKAVTKTTYGKTVVVTASAKSGYSVVGVAVTDASGNKVETKQSGSTYEFKMPASNVTVKLSLKKTTSSSKNPSSGDSSNIGLWIAVLAFSGISVLALLIVWLRKRKK